MMIGDIRWFCHQPLSLFYYEYQLFGMIHTNLIRIAKKYNRTLSLYKHIPSATCSKRRVQTIGSVVKQKHNVKERLSHNINYVPPLPVRVALVSTSKSNDGVIS